MKKNIGQLLFCLMFIFLIALTILEYEGSKNVLPVSNTTTQYVSKSSAEEYIDNQQNVLIIDLRDAHEYEKNHLLNAINIPYGELDQHIEELMPYQNSPIILYCEKGSRSKMAAKKLEQLGFTKLFVIKDEA